MSQFRFLGNMTVCCEDEDGCILAARNDRIPFYLTHSTKTTMHLRVWMAFFLALLTSQTVGDVLNLLHLTGDLEDATERAGKPFPTEGREVTTTLFFSFVRHDILRDVSPLLDQTLAGPSLLATELFTLLRNSSLSFIQSAKVNFSFSLFIKLLFAQQSAVVAANSRGIDGARQVLQELEPEWRDRIARAKEEMDSRLSKFIKETKCDSKVLQAAEEYDRYGLMDAWKSTEERCLACLGLGARKNSTYELKELFGLKKCHRLQRITTQSSIFDIVDAFRNVQEFASLMICRSESMELQNYFAREYFEAGTQALLWARPREDLESDESTSWRIFQSSSNGYHQCRIPDRPDSLMWVLVPALLACFVCMVIGIWVYAVLWRNRH